MDKYVNTGGYLRHLYDEIVINLHEKLACNGYPEVRPLHGRVFQYIEDTGSKTTELAKMIGITKQSVSSIIKQLEQWGYLKRKPDEADNRAILFLLTKKGKTLRQLGMNINREFEKKWERVLGKSAYHEFRKNLILLKNS